ncbi:UNVERIFIED_CONTAM: hypothetical protein Sangu_3200400 [Sesamum angustifolium]|uniref:Reverse transcriptase domain-containing protein n=1 Tax=Sesamum angustifolium TaxID=2727405 RepID=A0AAW2JLH0_9LAMI
MKDNPKRLKSDKYCRFHRDRGHTTEECHHLKNEIEKLIQRGHLRQYVNREQSRQPQETASTHTPNSDNLPTAGVIAVISGGPSRRGFRQRKESPGSRSQEKQLANAQSSPQHKLRQARRNRIRRARPRSERNQNNDALVISATLSNFWVKKVLVDSGSSADIIFYDAYVQLGVENAQLRKVNTPLTGFSGEMIEPLGEVTLPLSLGSYPKRSTKMVKFLVVKAPSAYNIILGRPSLNLFRAIASTFHMKLKFPTSDGVGEAVGDERMARECYANTLKRSREKLGGVPYQKGKRKNDGYGPRDKGRSRGTLQKKQRGKKGGSHRGIESHQSLWR